MAGGGWWGIVGCVVTTFLSAVFYLALWLNFLLLVAFKFAVTFFSSWWIRLPLALIVIAAWAILVLIAAAGKAAAGEAGRRAEAAAVEHGPLLSTVVPKDATGEVARVLGCQNYYAVLEIPVGTMHHPWGERNTKRGRDGRARHARARGSFCVLGIARCPFSSP